MTSKWNFHNYARHTKHTHTCILKCLHSIWTPDGLISFMKSNSLHFCVFLGGIRTPVDNFPWTYFPWTLTSPNFQDTSQSTFRTWLQPVLRAIRLIKTNRITPPHPLESVYTHLGLPDIAVGYVDAMMWLHCVGGNRHRTAAVADTCTLITHTHTHIYIYIYIYIYMYNQWWCNTAIKIHEGKT